MEYYSKCNVCGKISCYTDADIKENSRQTLISGMAAIGSVANAFGGTRYDMYEMNKISNNAHNKIVNFSKCPECGSIDTALVTKKFAIYSNKTKGDYSVKDLIKEANKYLEQGDFENAFCFATMVLSDDENNYDSYLIRFLSSYGIKKISDLNKMVLDYSNNQHFLDLINHSDEKTKKQLLLQCNKCKEKSIIQESEQLLDQIKQFLKNEDNLVLIEKNETAHFLLDQIDSVLVLFDNNSIDDNAIEKKLIDAKKNVTYVLACSFFNENEKSYFLKAKDLFETIVDYKDSKDKINICNDKINEFTASSKKTMIIIGIILLSFIFILILYKTLIGPIKYSHIEKYMDEKNYQAAYDLLMNVKDSDKKSILLDEVLKHGKYVLKNVSSFYDIFYEYDYKGNPSKIVYEYERNGSKYKHEYVFDYSYDSDDVDKLLITDYSFSKDRKSSRVREYLFNDKQFKYGFVYYDSYDNPKYNDYTMYNYIHLDNIKSVTFINTSKQFETIHFNIDGYFQESTTLKSDGDHWDYQSDYWEWSTSLVELTLDDHGLITDCRKPDADSSDYTISRQYTNGMMVKKVINDSDEIYNYTYNSSNNLIRIKKQVNEEFTGSEGYLLDFEWEWINIDSE